MANYHVRAGQDSGNEYQIIFHIPIPTASNAAGLTYRTALVNSGIGGNTVMATGVGAGLITAAELAQIQSGEIYEQIETWITNPGQALLAFQTVLDARYTALANPAGNFLRDFQRRLRLFGHDRTVP